MKRLTSYLQGSFSDGEGDISILVNPSTEEPVAELAGERDLGPAVAWARREGGPALRELTFAQRGAVLKQISKVIYENRDDLIGLAIENGGNTRGDAKFDIDGASGTLAYYAELGAKLGDARALADGESEQVGRSPRLHGRHILVPRVGVALHINAFNFPAWGFGEKAACALLAGMPVITKPATATAVVAHRIVELVAAADILPTGAFQLLLGPVGNLLDHAEGQDVLAFTGSGATGARLRGDQRLVERNVRVNVEADSLNAAVLGPDVEIGSDTWDMFVAEVSRDMTQKTGQKCTAIRRILVPQERVDDVVAALSDRLEMVKVGNPAAEGVTMGPLATASQLADVRQGFAALSQEAGAVWGGSGEVSPIGAPEGKGFFFGPVLLKCDDPAAAQSVHSLEVFGPVSTICPYDGTAATAVDLVSRGGGGLVSSVYADDRDFITEAVLGIAPHHGRIYLGSEKVASKSPGPGTVLPQLVHGGPGRAGAGEELGGTRGMAFYMQRTALQGDRVILDAMQSRYQPE